MHHDLLLILPPIVSPNSCENTSDISTTIIHSIHRLGWHEFASFDGICDERNEPILDTYAELLGVETLGAPSLKYDSFMESFLT
jgi:hypothetical protein